MQGAREMLQLGAVGRFLQRRADVLDYRSVPVARSQRSQMYAGDLLRFFEGCHTAASRYLFAKPANNFRPCAWSSGTVMRFTHFARFSYCREGPSSSKAATSKS